MKSGRLNTIALWLALVVVAFLNWGPGFAGRNGSGTFTIPNTFTAGSTITASDFNENFTDIANEITNSLALDGQSSMTGPIKAASGSVGSPSITFSADQDTGFYRIGANNIGAAVGGSKVFDVSATGVAIIGDADATTVKQGGYALVPAGITVSYAGSAAPDGWLLSYGQAVSRTTYASLFTTLSTAYGTGDGSTTFNLPDCRGRVIAGKDNMGGSAAGRLTSSYFGADATTLGAVGGAESHTLTEAQLPSLTKTVSITDPGHYHPYSGAYSDDGNAGAGGSSPRNPATKNTSSATTGISATVSFGSGNAHNNVQPTIVMNCIIKY